MKLPFALLPLGLLLPVLALSLAAPRPVPPKSAGPPACFAGEPPRSTTCHNSGCHTDFPLNSGSAHLLLDLGGAENGYTPGQLYRVRVALTTPGLVRGGFQAIALQDNKDTLSPGTFTLTEPLRTQRVDRDFPHADTGCFVYSKVWIEHTDYGIDDPVLDTIRWEFDWRAPLSDVGSITFYAASVESNADLDPSGDHVYSVAQTISSVGTSVVPPAPLALEMRLSPNPSRGRFEVQFLDPHVKIEGVAIYDNWGRLVQRIPGKGLAGAVSLQLDAAPGMYYVWVSTTRGSVSRKLVLE